VYRDNVKIAGNSGPLAAIQKKSNIENTCPFRWHATSSEIVHQLTESGDGFEIVIDLKPKVAENISLYRFMNIWGFSYEDWTPVALHLEALFRDRSDPSPEKFKKRFLDKDAERSQLVTFLYLKGGVKNGTWSWGMAGRVNGALLWPDVLDYFCESLKKECSRGGLSWKGDGSPITSQFAVMMPTGMGSGL